MIKFNLFLENLKQKGTVYKSSDRENTFLLCSENNYKITYVEINSIEYSQTHKIKNVDYIVAYLIDKDIFCWIELVENDLRKISSDFHLKDYEKFLWLKKPNSSCPTKEELSKLLWELPSTKLGKKFGVTDKCIEKWAKKYNLSKPTRGYWQKLKANELLKNNN